MIIIKPHPLVRYGLLYMITSIPCTLQRSRKHYFCILHSGLSLLEILATAIWCFMREVVWNQFDIFRPHSSFFFFFFQFLSRPSSALISWSSTQVLVDHWGTFCAGGYPYVHFSFFLPGDCGGVWTPDLLITRRTFYHQTTLPPKTLHCSIEILLLFL